MAEKADENIDGATDEGGGNCAGVFYLTDEDEGGREKTTKRVVTVEELAGLINGGETQGALDESLTITDSDNNGLLLIDLHPKTTPVRGIDDGLVPIISSGEEMAWLKPGRYFVLSSSVVGRTFDMKASERIREAMINGAGILLATSEDQVAGNGITPEPMTLETRGGKFGDSLPLWALKKDRGKGYVSLFDATGGVLVNAALNIIAKRIGHEEDSKSSNKITSIAISSVFLPTDRVNKKFYDVTSPEHIEQIVLSEGDGHTAEFGVNLANAKDQANNIERLATFTMNWDNLPPNVHISSAQGISEYDRRVHDAIYSLWRAMPERPCYSITEIYHAMGYTGRPNGGTIKKIFDSETRLMAPRVKIDTEDEAKAYSGYNRFEYDGLLLPAERVTGYADGQPTSSLLHLFREPPLGAIARGRNQMTACSVKVLQTPVSKTDKNTKVQRYLIEQIAWMKNDKGKAGKKRRSRNRKITYEAIFDAAGVSGRKAKARKKEDVRKILDYWVSIGYIRRFEESENGVTIIL